jgi:hypothetical protein
MNDKKQLLLFGELPPEPKPAKKAKKAKAEPASNVVQMPTAPETQPAA